MADDNSSIFSEEVLASLEEPNLFNQKAHGSITVLGQTFANDEERRAYFREELRKKLPELKKIEGFPIGEDEDIINLSDPPYYTACPNPWLNDFIKEWEEEKKQLVKEGKRVEEKEVKEPYASDVSEGKNNPIYLLHTYHTKVPHPAIMRYLLYYTQPGDIIFDGFAGTGMAGVAAEECRGSDTTIKERLSSSVKNSLWGSRHALLSDLSPAASFISANLNSDYNAISIKKSMLAKIEIVSKKLEWMFMTKDEHGILTPYNFVLWSEVVGCPSCGAEIKLWDVTADTEHGRMKDNFRCPQCDHLLTKADCQYLQETKVDFGTNETKQVRKYDVAFINYYSGKKRRYKKPDEHDYEVLSKIDDYKISKWFPTESIMFKGEEWGDTWRAGIHFGVNRVHHFYTKRNLIFLSELWDILSLQEKFIATSILSRNLTKLNRYILKPRTPMGEINGPLSGTFYISSEFVEQNPIDLIKSKIPSFSWYNKGPVTSVCAAQNAVINDNSIDYIFTDPPFGANIMYSELNFLWEAWLKVYTNNEDEAIESVSQNKSTGDYGNLMVDCFKEYYRVLKPNKWMTVEFSNTSAAVWNSIQYAISKAGFVIANVSALDKKHGGIKSMAYSTAVKEDLVISCYKPSEQSENRFELCADDISGVWDFIDNYLDHLPRHTQKNNATTAVPERGAKILYDKLITYYVQRGHQVPINAIDFQKGLRERYIERDGMFFSASQVAEYDRKKINTTEFVPMGIIVSDEANGIEWLNNQLRIESKTYQDLYPDWMQAISGVRNGDILPELKEILEENFIEDAGGKWRLPNIQDDIDKNTLRTKGLLKEFKLYVDQASKPKGKLKEVRIEAVRAGFKDCYIKKDFSTIVIVADKMPQNLLNEDEQLTLFYDMARNHV